MHFLEVRPRSAWHFLGVRPAGSLPGGRLSTVSGGPDARSSRRAQVLERRSGSTLAFARGMPRRPRMYRADLVYEVVSQTLANSYALRPCAESTELILGVYGRAMHNYPSIRLHAINPLSTHDTILISSDKPEEIAPFLCFVKTNVSKEIRRLHGLKYPVFGGRRAKPLPIYRDEASQVKRLRYVLAQGTKEDLVASPRDWPGVTGVHALEKGETLSGVWFDRAAEDAARRRGETFDKYEHSTRYEVPLSPLPCWAHLSEEKWRAEVTRIVDEIEQTEAKRRRAEGKTVLGVKKVKAKKPTYMPDEVAKSPSPLVLAASETNKKALRRALDTFCKLFWGQSQRSREEPDADITFPPLSFPPAPPMTSGPALDLDLDFAFAPG